MLPRNSAEAAISSLAGEFSSMKASPAAGDWMTCVSVFGGLADGFSIFAGT